MDKIVCLLVNFVLFCVCILPLSTGATEYRSYDGSGNNLANPLQGSAGQLHLRSPKYVPSYGYDGSSVRADLPNVRFISNVLNSFEAKDLSPRKLSDMHTSFGHFIDHDFTLTPQNDSDPLPIPIPQCDIPFDPGCLGTVTLPFSRSSYAIKNGHREQMNIVSSYLDGSVVYGSSEARARALRSFQDGKMLVNANGEVPLNTANLDVDNPVRRAPEEMRMMGDHRGNITPQLLSLHSLFLREHNRYCDVLKSKNPTWDDERLYQEARRRVVAHIQHITYREYLPALLGEPLPLYAGYDPNVNVQTDNLFVTSSFRYGHPEVNGIILRLNEQWMEIPAGHLYLRDTYFNPTVALSDGIEPVLRGMIFKSQAKVDAKYHTDMRNHLFGNPGRTRPNDLQARNILRGRDHGLPTYNDARALFGLKRKASFEEISSNNNTVAALEQAYATVDEIDVLVGSLAEDHYRGNLGELMTASVMDQFHRMRAGDRFWYENNQFTPDELQAIKTTTLVDIITRNTEIVYRYANAFFTHDSQLDGGLFPEPPLHSPELEAEFENHIELDKHFVLYWTVDYTSATIRIAARAKTQGWMGIGFSRRTNATAQGSLMYDADVTIGRIKGDNAFVQDFYSFELGIPSLDTDIGCKDDLSSTELVVGSDGTRTLRFSRPFRTQDAIELDGRLTTGDDVVKKSRQVYCDVELEEGRSHLVLFATNPTLDELAYHGATRGFVHLVLIPPRSGQNRITVIIIAVVVTVVGALCGAAALYFFFARGGKHKDNTNAPRGPPLCIMFTDIEQSTHLWSTSEVTMAEVIERHNAVIRNIIARHKAYEVKTIGDSFMIATRNAWDAALVATDIQIELFREEWGLDALALMDQVYSMHSAAVQGKGADTLQAKVWNGPRIRIGVHYADTKSGINILLDPVSHSFDYHGTPVNIAGRIESLGCGGQILASRAFIEACPELRQEQLIDFELLGHCPIKGVLEPMAIYQLTPVMLCQRQFPPLVISEESYADEIEPEDQDAQRFATHPLVQNRTFTAGEMMEKVYAAALYGHTLMDRLASSERAKMMLAICEKWGVQYNPKASQRVHRDLMSAVFPVVPLQHWRKRNMRRNSTATSLSSTTRAR